MIRINLLKQAQVKPVSVSELVSSSRSPKWLISLVLLLVVAGLGAYIFMNPPTFVGAAFGPDGQEPAAPVPPKLVTTVPERPSVRPVIVTAHAVEEIVKEIQEEVRTRPRRLGYQDLVPSQRVEFQQMAAARLLKRLKEITPPEIGFANVVFTLPSDFYLHGMAYSGRHYERFKQDLQGMGQVSVKPGILRAAGERGAAQEFSFYGNVDFPVSAGSGGERIVSSSTVNQELRSLQQLAARLGIRMESPKLDNSSPWGAYKRQIYRAEMRGDYRQLEALFNQMQVSNSKVGLMKMALRATGDEALAASMDLTLYVN